MKLSQSSLEHWDFIFLSLFRMSDFEIRIYYICFDILHSTLELFLHSLFVFQ
jgi:hypothetical protein